MLTIRQFQRLWTAADYRQLARLCLEKRAEYSSRLVIELARPLAAAALVIVRLDELAQLHVPLSRTLSDVILSAEEADGGWGDATTTALCIRALRCGHGQGQVIDRGLDYLVGLQRPEGLWPRIPLRRMPADPFVSAIVLLHLDGGRSPKPLHLDAAASWFQLNRAALDTDTARIWNAAAPRCATARRPAASSAATKQLELAGVSN